MNSGFRKIVVALMILLCSNSIFAQQAELVNFSIEPVSIEPGGTATIDINMSNPTIEVASVILGITLPEGYTCVQNKIWNEDDEEWNYFYGALTERKRSKFVLSENYDQETNTLHLTINGMGQVFKLTDGAIATFEIKAADNAIPGRIKVYKQSWSSQDGLLGGGRPDFYTPILLSQKLNSSGFATFSYPYNVKISDAKVYSATLNLEESEINATQISSGVVPAGNGVILVGEPNAMIPLTYVEEAPPIENNDLKATIDADGTIPEIENALILYDKAFRRYSGSAFTACRAYFPYSEFSNMKMFSVIFDDATIVAGVKGNCIKNAVTKMLKKNEVVIVKDGTMYNVAGERLK